LQRGGDSPMREHLHSTYRGLPFGYWKIQKRREFYITSSRSGVPTYSMMIITTNAGTSLKSVPSFPVCLEGSFVALHF
jgi:hypothetical protein